MPDCHGVAQNDLLGKTASVYEGRVDLQNHLQNIGTSTGCVATSDVFMSGCVIFLVLKPLQVISSLYARDPPVHRNLSVMTSVRDTSWFEDKAGLYCSMQLILCKHIKSCQLAPTRPSLAVVFILTLSPVWM